VNEVDFGNIQSGPRSKLADGPEGRRGARCTVEVPTFLAGRDGEASVRLLLHVRRSHAAALHQAREKVAAKCLWHATFLVGVAVCAVSGAQRRTMCARSCTKHPGRAGHLSREKEL
jgi:hypothetical protein